jgi:hypothetical protein|tara:strand:- start:109 stop:474 length:366 start_codon:yes stop_codon:yes gene_type:complete
MSFVRKMSVLLITLSLSVIGVCGSPPTVPQKTLSSGIDMPIDGTWVDVSTGLEVSTEEVSMFGTYRWSNNPDGMVSVDAELVSYLAPSNSFVSSLKVQQLRFVESDSWVIESTTSLHARVQ